MTTILVYADTGEQGVTETSLEALTFARSLADESSMTPFAALAVLAGPMPGDVAETLAAYGVGEVHHLTGPAFETYAPAARAAGVQQTCEEVAPDIVMAGGSPRETEVMAHLAARLGARFAANVLSVAGREPLVVTRQVAGGTAMEDMALPKTPALLTVAGHALSAEPAAVPGRATWHDEPCEVPDAAARLVSIAPKQADNTSALTGARVVVGAGRGAGGPNGFDDVVRLAEMLGGAVGISRVAADLGWHPADEQVGQTGSRISPELYIPCGISGAIQHWAGCSSAKTILAINQDPDAPMVTRADYAVIGDMHRILPAIIDELERRS